MEPHGRRPLASRAAPPTLDIRPVRASDRPALEVLFAGLDTTWFRPHDLGAAGARTVAAHVGRDVYLIGFLGDEPVAYGMLRGWDEGYPVPSLGVAVRDGYRDLGLGRQMMHALHEVVSDRGGDRVRLRVAPGNARARHLYASLGYRQVGVERGELVLLLDLDGGGGVGRREAGTHAGPRETVGAPSEPRAAGPGRERLPRAAPYHSGHVVDATGWPPPVDAW